MILWKFLFLVLASAITTLLAKVIPVFHESFEDCADPNEKAGLFDFSRMEIIADNNTHAHGNGTWKMTNDLEAPWVVRMYTERFERGHWSIFGINKKIKDFCAVMHNPTEIWYIAFQNIPNCPAKKGTEWFFDMIPLEFSIFLSKNLVGKWRFVSLGEFEVNGVMKKECIRLNYDLVETKDLF